MTARFCARCGAGIPENSNFCPRCGAEVVAPATPSAATLETMPAYVPPPPTVTVPPPAASVPPPPIRAAAAPAVAAHPAPPPRRKSGMLIGVPIAMIVLGLVVWALLAGMPFGRDDRAPRVEAPKVEPITEGDAPAGSNSRELVVEEEEGEAPTATRAPAPNVATTPATTPAVPRSTPTAVPMPATRTPRPAPAPVSRSTPPPMTSDSPAASSSGDISQSEALAAVRGYVAARDQYGISSECVEVTPVEFRNRGYTVSVGDRCDGKSLGRWRIDSQTREIFRQQSDGRFLRP